MNNDQVSNCEIATIIRELGCVIKNNVIGDVVEFGCYSGGTSIYLAKLLSSTDKLLYVYDSFEGLPNKSDKDISPIGEQFKVGELTVSKKQFILNIKKAGAKMPIIKKAWFKDLTSSDVPNKISFAFLDGDYYQSIKDSLKLITNNLSDGAIIIVDDYVNDSLPGAKKAVDEWLINHHYKIKIENSLAIVYCKW